MTDTLKQLDKPERKAAATKQVIAIAEKYGGTITPEIILSEAKNKRSPLHGFFCWDDTEAAQEYRRIQAQQLIRRIKVTITASDDKQIRVRAFVSIQEPVAQDEEEDIDGHGVNCRAKRGVYVTMETACRVNDYRDQMMAACKRDVEAFRSKYSVLREASEILAAMDGFEQGFGME